jgi:hypothetical protein
VDVVRSAGSDVAGGRATPERRRGAVRTVARAGVRGFGILTSPARPGPDFLIIGAKRCGTTSLHAHLQAHPNVLPLFPAPGVLPMRAPIKGVHYFDHNAGRGEAWYRSHFPTSLQRAQAERRLGGPVLAGEASPYYLHHPLAAARARRSVPEARLIVLVRDPVERASSHYREQRRRGFEPLGTFEEALAAEPGRTEGEVERLVADPRYRSFTFEHQAYAGQGEYVEALERWADAFGPEAMCVLRSEDLFADVQGRYDAVLRFLGLPAHHLGDVAPRNATVGEPMAEGTAAALLERFAPHEAALGRWLAERPPCR